jgi:hypothetical protein
MVQATDQWYFQSPCHTMAVEQGEETNIFGQGQVGS